jgi:hypothetical protein
VASLIPAQNRAYRIYDASTGRGAPAEVAFGSSFASFWHARRQGVAASSSVPFRNPGARSARQDEARGPNRSPTMIIAGYALLALGYTLLAFAALTGIGH